MVLELRELKSEDAFRERVAPRCRRSWQAMTADSYTFIRQAVQGYAQRRPAFWSGQELAAAGFICLLVFGSTFPLVLPFMAMDEPWIALRISHGIAVVMLFILGWKLGRWSGASPLGSGALLAAGGVALAVLCVALRMKSAAALLLALAAISGARALRYAGEGRAGRREPRGSNQAKARTIPGIGFRYPSQATRSSMRCGRAASSPATRRMPFSSRPSRSAPRTGTPG